VKIRLKMNVGVFHNLDDVRAGDVVDVDDAEGLRYCMLGYAEPVTKVAEKSVAREELKVETAMLKEEAETATMAEPGVVIHDVTPETGGVTEDKPLEAPKPRMPGTTVPSKRGARGPRKS